jgi:hypothetical protein
MVEINKIKDFESIEIGELPEIMQTEEKLLKTAEALEKKANRIEKVSIALGDMLGQIEKDKELLKEAVISNVSNNIAPYIEDLKKSRLGERQTTLITTLESNIDSVHPLIEKFESIICYTYSSKRNFL